MVVISPTGVPSLDEILGGGLPDRTLTLILGVPGSGKTILAMQIAAHHAKQGTRALIFTAFSESHERMLAGLGEFSFADPAALGDTLRFYSVQTILEQGLDAVADLIVETTRQERAASGDRDSLRFLYRLRSRLALLDATVLVTYEATMEDRQAYGTLTIADGILVLHNNLDGERHRRWLEVAKLRGMRHHDGLHTLTITDGGICCYPRQEAAYRAMDYTVGKERAGLGLPELDAMLGGGLNRSTSTFLAGSPGTGKTLIALHYLLAGAAADEPGLYVALAESGAQLVMKAASFGLDLAGRGRARRDRPAADLPRGCGGGHPRRDAAGAGRAGGDPAPGDRSDRGGGVRDPLLESGAALPRVAAQLFTRAGG